MTIGLGSDKKVTQREGVSETASYRAVYYFTEQLLPADVNPLTAGQVLETST